MKKNINPGIYLVIDPSMDETQLINKLKSILSNKIIAIQIWDNFRPNQHRKRWIQNICKIGASYNIPILINNDWKLLSETDLDGVHFDTPPKDFEKIMQQHPNAIYGLTCGNNLVNVQWAAHHNLDYISFCSLFPTESAPNCELINFNTINKAKEIFKNPIFLSGGIRPENMKKLQVLDFDGIAVISGIMNAENPVHTINEYYKNLKPYT